MRPPCRTCARDVGRDMSTSLARRLAQYRQDFIAHGASFNEQWMLYPGGATVSLNVSFSAHRLADARMAMLCEAREAVAVEPESLRSVDALLHTAVMISPYGQDGRPLVRNPAARASVRDLDERLEDRIVDASAHAALLAVLAQGGSATRTLAVRTPQGERWHEISARHCRDAVTGQDAVLVSEADVSAIKRTEAQAQSLALHDPLTGLPNRSHVMQRFAQAVDRIRGAGHEAALMFIDLDHFKDVNDTRGHDTGDALLCQVAQRLLGAVPPAALVARLGGDEFVVMVPGAAAAEAMALADRVCAQLKEPFSVADAAVVVGASVGIAVAPGHGRSRQELTRRADIALYTAKAQRGSVCLFDESQDRATAERAAWVAELREAIARRCFKLHYQPRVSAADGRMVSVEALVRWQHPRHGLVPPDRFIAIAEHAGLMGELGALVLDEACLQMAAWRLAGVPVRKVSVNVSMQQLVTGRLPQEVRETLARHAVPPQALELEVTESLLADDADSAQDQLRQLRALGIEIALDDFGTGYSAMSQLRRLPIDVMKIDRSFVVDLGSDDGALAIARAIVALAGALGLRVVAEGVETAEHARRLRELGCDELQGYHFARPLPADELVAFVRGEPARLALARADTLPA